jgi:hypothetical protein
LVQAYEEEEKKQSTRVNEDADEEEEEKDKHPEKRMKAAFAKFEEERLQELRKEYPTLKMSQLKEKVWKEVRLIER